MSAILFRLAVLGPLLGLGTVMAVAQVQRPGGTATEPAFQNYVQRAAAARDAGDTEGALQNYREALKIDPHWQEGWWNLGTLLYDQDRYSEAIPAFQKLTELAPQASPAWTFLGLCEFETREYASALEHLSQGESPGGMEDPEIARVAKYHLALLLIRNGNFERAGALLNDPGNAAGNSPQMALASGLALLRVPLLPQQVDPSKEALVREAGNIAALLAAGDDVRALAALRAATAKYDDAPHLHRVFGDTLNRNGEREAAAAEFRREAELAEGSPERAAEWYGAVAAQPPAVGTAGKSGEELFAAAMRDYANQKYPEAIAELKIFLQQNAHSGTGWAVLGLSEFALRDYDNALIHLQRGEELGMSGDAENVALAKYRLGILLNRSGRFGAAEEVLTSATFATSALASEISFAVGMAVLHKSEFPEEVPGSQRELIKSAGEVAELLHASKYDWAFPRLEELLKKYPDVAFLHYTYGTALASLSQYDEAARQFRAETPLSPESELPYLGLASLELKRHRAAEALEAAWRAVQLAPGNAAAHYLLGRSALETGKTEQAIAELQKAAAITPGSPEIHFALAKAYAKAGDAQKAEEERATFAQLNALAEERRRRGNQAYGAHGSGDGGLAGAESGSERAAEDPVVRRPQ